MRIAVLVDTAALLACAPVFAEAPGMPTSHPNGGGWFASIVDPPNSVPRLVVQAIAPEPASFAAIAIRAWVPLVNSARRRCANPIRRNSNAPAGVRACCLLAVAASAVVLVGGQTAFASPIISTLAQFDYANGAEPHATLLADAAGNLYGTTARGGPNDAGTVFQIAAGTHAFSTLAAFDGSNGLDPQAALAMDAAGNLYGTTDGGGADSFGTVFRIAAGTHALSALVTFDGNNGAHPAAGLIADAAGNLYGTTSSGGAGGFGTVFQLAAGTHALSTIASFNSNNGSFCYSSLLADVAGNLYGTTWGGGTNDDGTVHHVAAGTRALTTLATFSGGNGSHSFAELISDAAGNLYGTTPTGGANSGGTVFEVAAGTHALTTLASFNTASGTRSYAGLISDAAGNLYGTTYFDGANGDGTVFRLAAGAHTLSTVASFDGGDGSGAEAGLIADAAGNLYGTTTGGGSGGAGTVFELTGTGFVPLIPEPASGALIAIGGLGLFARRRRA